MGSSLNGPDCIRYFIIIEEKINESVGAVHVQQNAYLSHNIELSMRTTAAIVTEEPDEVGVPVADAQGTFFTVTPDDIIITTGE
jgi:hypothetical protein